MPLASHSPFFLEHALREGPPNLSQTFVPTPPRESVPVKKRKSRRKDFILPSLPLARVERLLGITYWIIGITRRIVGSENEWQCGIYFHLCSRLHPHPPECGLKPGLVCHRPGQTPSLGPAPLWHAMPFQQLPAMATL